MRSFTKILSRHLDGSIAVCYYDIVLVLNCGHANGGELLTKVKVFDLYTGKQVAAGCKSMAFNLTFQDKERTLTDGDIDMVIKKIVDVVGETFKAKLRD